MWLESNLDTKTGMGGNRSDRQTIAVNLPWWMAHSAAALIQILACAAQLALHSFLGGRPLRRRCGSKTLVNSAFCNTVSIFRVYILHGRLLCNDILDSTLFLCCDIIKLLDNEVFSIMQSVSEMQMCIMCCVILKGTLRANGSDNCSNDTVFAKNGSSVSWRRTNNEKQLPVSTSRLLLWWYHFSFLVANISG